MQLTYNRVNQTAETARGNNKPTDVIPRGAPGTTWLVPFSPVWTDKPADWRFYQHGDQIVIPLFPYLVPNNPTDALGFAFQLGVIAIQQLGNKPVKRLHLSLGDPVNQIFDPNTQQTVLSFQLGLGVIFE